MNHIDRAQRQQLFRDILKGVSRSFYLTLRVLPAQLREPIALAYLLARAADTLADTTVLPQTQRLQYLNAFKRYVLDTDLVAESDNIQHALQGHLENPDEARLLHMLPQLFTLFTAQSDADKSLIRRVVNTLLDGMIFDLDTFPMEESGEVKALQHEIELDKYTYMVAGCVGEFWTDISMLHVPALAVWDRDKLVEQGVRFGKALQLTNILRDLPRDLRIGRCYLPQEWLSQQNLHVDDLFNISNIDKAQALLRRGIVIALKYYEAAERYLLAIPRHCLRLRLAVLWPMMIGLATLQKLATSTNWLDFDTTIRIDRRWVYTMIAQSLVKAGSNTGLRSWVNGLRVDCERSISGML